MRLHNLRQELVGKAFAVAFMSGCGEANLDASGAERVGAPLPNGDSAIPTLEEFVASVQQKIWIGDTEVDAYVVEGDMLIGYDTLVDYYEAAMLPVQEKSVGITYDTSQPGEVPSPVAALLTRRGFPAVVRYCFDSTWTGP